jgi:hypothetical protein
LVSRTSLDSYLEQRQRIKCYQSFDRQNTVLGRRHAIYDADICQLEQQQDQQQQQEPWVQQLSNCQQQRLPTQPAAALASGRGGAHGWNNLRAVMAYYCSLRKIKRNVEKNGSID